MSIKYNFDFKDVTDTLGVVNMVKEYGICRIPNYLNTEITSKLKTEALKLVTDEPNDDYEFGKATRFQRHLNTMPTIGEVFSNKEMSKISQS